MAQMMQQYEKSDKNAAVRRQKHIIANGRSYIATEADKRTLKSSKIIDEIELTSENRLTNMNTINSANTRDINSE
jgi:hypothetical protein